MFLYPLAIVLILLALFGKFFSHDKKVYNWVISLTLISALYDLLRTLGADSSVSSPPLTAKRGLRRS